MYGFLKEKILELRSLGNTYNQIKNILGCSKGTISFHCGQGQKEKSRSRLAKRRKNNPLLKKLEHFQEVNKPNNYIESLSKITNKKISTKLSSKIMRFSRNKKGEYNSMFTVKDLIEKIGDNPTCYLTGRSIDLNHSRSYHLDHVVPKSKGGDDSLDNCQIACREANIAKGDLSYNEFIKLCGEVLEYNKNNQVKSGDWGGRTLTVRIFVLL